MSIRYIFRSVLVEGSRVYAVFDKKISHSVFSRVWDKVFSVEHQQPRYDEKECKDFYEQVVRFNRSGDPLPHGALDADQLAAGFEAIRRKKSELGIPFDCDYLRT